mgnify:FL=1
MLRVGKFVYLSCTLSRHYSYNSVCYKDEVKVMPEVRSSQLYTIMSEWYLVERIFTGTIYAHTRVPPSSPTIGLNNQKSTYQINFHLKTIFVSFNHVVDDLFIKPCGQS